jgi:hypothetical protein
MMRWVEKGTRLETLRWVGREMVVEEAQGEKSVHVATTKDTHVQ